jgi:transcriptional regulator with XRE-family HTH domain
MNSIKKLRKKMGFNQEHLAIYLDIERGLLSMVEIGKRELPTNALIKLNDLEQSILQSSLPETANLTFLEEENLTKELQLFLQEHQQFIKQKALLLQKKLKVIESNYNNALQLLQIVRMKQQKISNTTKNKKDLLWFATTEAMALEKLSKNNLIVQKKVQLEIDALQHINIIIG